MTTTTSKSQSAKRQAYNRSFAGRRFNWITQVLLDRDLPPLSLHVAIVLASRLHSKAGEKYFTAWLFQETIAQALDITDRSVRNGLAALVARGHLTVTQRGYHESAIYKPVLKPESCIQTGTDFPALEDLDRNELSGLKPSDRKNYVIQTGTDFPTEENDGEENELREEEDIYIYIYISPPLSMTQIHRRHTRHLPTSPAPLSIGGDSIPEG